MLAALLARLRTRTRCDRCRRSDGRFRIFRHDDGAELCARHSRERLREERVALRAAFDCAPVGRLPHAVVAERIAEIDELRGLA